MVLIKTGSIDLDNLIYGGIKGGLVFDFFGENGSGKTQTCFSIVTNFIKTYKDLMVFYIDTTGNFRIERILEMLRTSNDDGDKEQTKDISDRIHFERIFTLRDQFNIIEEIKNSSKIDKIKLIIFDSVTSLFTTEAQIPIRHLRLRKMMHDLSLLSINEDIAIIVTNMIRNRIESSSDNYYYPNYTKSANNNINYKKKSKIQEFMINSMSIHCHFRVNFAIKDLDRRMYSATLVQPSIYENVIFKVTKQGISNWTANDL